MPQPLSSVLKGKPYEITLDPNCLLQEPGLAKLVAAAIGWSSNIEYGLGSTLVAMLGAHVKPGFALYSAIISNSAQRKAVNAVAEAILSPEDFATFKIVDRLAKAASLQRHELAHGLWGTSPQVPSALLLADPQYVQGVFAQHAHFWSLPSHKKPDPSVWPEAGFDPTKIFVYREKDLLNIVRDFEQTASIVALFRSLVDPQTGIFDQHLPEPQRDAIYRQLSTQRLFAEALSQSRENKTKTQKAQPQSPE